MNASIETAQQENVSRRGSLNGKIRYLLNRIKDDTIDNRLYWNKTTTDKEGIVFTTYQKPFNIRIHEQYVEVTHIDGESIRIPVKDINEIHGTSFLPYLIGIVSIRAEYNDLRDKNNIMNSILGSLYALNGAE